MTIVGTIIAIIFAIVLSILLGPVGEILLISVMFGLVLSNHLRNNTISNDLQKIKEKLEIQERNDYNMSNEEIEEELERELGDSSELNEINKRVRGETVKHDCGFTKEDSWFRYRAAAIIIENGCVLFVKNERDDYYYSVGGGVHIGEKAEDAVRREVFEETGIAYEVERLAFIHENFFIGSGSLDGYKCHEITLYFLMKSRGTQELNSESYSAGVREYMHWIPIDHLDNYKAFPTFFRDKIKDIKDRVEHIVTYEYSGE